MNWSEKPWEELPSLMLFLDKILDFNSRFFSTKFGTHKSARLFEDLLYDIEKKRSFHV